MKKILFPIILIILIASLVSYQPVRQRLGIALSKPVASLQTGLSKAGNKFEHIFSFVGSISRLRQENDDLSNKLLTLEVDRSRISELEHENNLLKKELGFVGEQTGTTLMPAKIIGRDPEGYLDNFTIDKGSDDGVIKNLAVISGGALVGQVSEVYPKQSKVTMITSKDSIVLAMLQDSRANGILRGGLSGLTLEDITQDVDYKPGEYVVTSGLDGEIKSGILIGTATDIKTGTSGLFKDIGVEPSVDLSKLEIVFLMK